MESKRSRNASTSHKNVLKTVLITGGGSGIGLATAHALLKNASPESSAPSPYRVVLIGRNRAKLDQAAQSLGGTSDRVSIAVCDLRKSAEMRQMIEKIEGTYKGIYGLVNNAGIYPLGSLSSTTEAAWDDALQVNLKAPFLLMQAVARKMAQNANGGRIINISSTAGILPNHLALAYSVSKAGLVQLTRTVAKELGKDGITVNCICPGIVRTPLHDSTHSDQSELEEFYEKRGASLPMGRVGEAHDVSGAVRFLLSDEAAWMTGETMIIDGGRLLL